MKARFPLSVLATLVASSALFVTSCKKEMITSEEVTINSKKGATNSTLATNISVNWDNWPDGTNYNVARAIADFGDINNFTQAEQARTLISVSRLRVTLLKNEYGASGGVITNSIIEQSDGFEMNFKVKFHSAFDFKSKGVVGFGFNIGDGADGVANGTGGSFRLMWDKDSNGNFYLKPYIYYADQPGSSGNDFGARYPATGSIGGSVWYNVKMKFKANTKLDRNGRAELYINNVQVLNIPIRWTKDNSKRKVNQLLFSNYRSGAGSESSSDANVWFDDFSLVSSIPTYTSTWCDSAYTVTNLFDLISATNYHLTEIKTGNVNLQMALAGKVQGETGTEFARRMDCCVAFNASMGIDNPPPGETHPVGVQIINGTIVQQLSTIRYTLGIKNNDYLVSYPNTVTATSMVNDGANYALTGFTPLIENHQAVSQTVLNSVANYSAKNPRQVIAQLDNGNILVLSCGGRGYGGEGMTAQDLVRVLSALDVRFAFNLDGGGSVTTVLNGQRITPLIDGSGTLERPRPNWLYVKYNHPN